MTAAFGLSPFGIAPFGGIGGTDLLDWQFELSGLVFGCGTKIEVTHWDPGTHETRTQDVDAVHQDARVFGRDYKSPASWALTFAIKDRNHASALATLEPLQGVWESEATRLTPGGVVPLRYGLGGRVRRVFGRPRRFTPVLENLVFGHVPVVADFALAETGSYADVEESVQVGVGRAQLAGVGLGFPVTFPALWGSAGEPQQKTVSVGGTRPSWLTVVIEGPVFDPYVLVGDSVFALRGGITAGQSVMLSGVPWAQGVFRSDGAAVSEMLAPSTRLAQLRVRPGRHLVTFGGIDNTGTARATVSWRDAYASI